MTRRHNQIPHDPADEAALLGAALLNAQAATLIAEETTPGDFWVPVHQRIRNTIVDIVRAGGPVDVATVASGLTLSGNGTSNGAGGDVDIRRTLTEIQAGCPASVNAPAYLRSVHDWGRRRQFLLLADELLRISQEGGVSDGVLAALEGLQTQERVDTTEWAPLPIEPFLGGDDDPTERPSILARTDGTCLLYPGKVHFLAGEPESGKSFLALAACAEQIDCGNNTVYLDFEDSGAAVIGRLLALGVQPDRIVAHFGYIRPSSPLQRVDWAALCQMLLRRRPTIAVIDGLTEALTLHALDLQSNRDIASFLELLARPIVRLGPAVLILDHVTKDKEQRGRWPIGAQHKLAGLDGASYSLEVVKQVMRSSDGLVKVWIQKDRPGRVRETSPGGKLAAEMHTRPGGDMFVVELQATAGAGGADGSPFKPAALMERVSRWLELNPDASGRAIDDGVTGKARWVRHALRVLVDDGNVAVIGGGRGGGSVYRVDKPFRATTDDPREAEFHDT